MKAIRQCFGKLFRVSSGSSRAFVIVIAVAGLCGHASVGVAQEAQSFRMSVSARAGSWASGGDRLFASALQFDYRLSSDFITDATLVAAPRAAPQPLLLLLLGLRFEAEEGRFHPMSGFELGVAHDVDFLGPVLSLKTGGRWDFTSSIGIEGTGALQFVTSVEGPQGAGLMGVGLYVRL